MIKLNYNRLLFHFIIGLIAMTPIFIGIKARQFYSPFITNRDKLDSGVQYDVFTYYKFAFVFMVTLVLVVIFTLQYITGKMPLMQTPITTPLLLLGLFMMISTVCSNFIHTALWGHFNRLEGMISYLCYFVITWLVTQITFPRNYLEIIARAFYPVTIINVILIACHYGGYNIEHIFLPQSPLFEIEKFVLIGTLGQANYLSGFFAMLAAFYLGIVFVTNEKTRCIEYAIAFSVNLSVMFIAVSTTGFLTISAIIVVVTIIGLITKHRMKMLASFYVAVVVIVLLLTILDPKIWDESLGMLQNKQERETEVMQSVEATTYDEFVLPVLPSVNTSAFSSREYIWKKTVELIVENPIFGYGMDTLMLEFPHYNIDARAGISNEKLIVDKPHSIYIGYLYGAGILGLVTFLWVVGVVLKTSIRQFKIKRVPLQLPIILVIIAYLIQGLTIDTTVATSVIFWVFVGINMNSSITRLSTEK